MREIGLFSRNEAKVEDVSDWTAVSVSGANAVIALGRKHSSSR